MNIFRRLSLVCVFVLFAVCHWRLLVGTFSSSAPLPSTAAALAAADVSDPTSDSIFTRFERLFELAHCLRVFGSLTAAILLREHE